MGRMRGYRNGAPVLIQIHGRAINRPSRNEGVKFVRCLGPASILQTILASTKLRGFGGVDTPKPDSGAVNFERVAVDDGCLPGQIVCEQWRGAKACRQNQSGKSDSSERQFERPNPFSASRNETMRALERLRLATPICDDASLAKLEEDVADYLREAKRCDASGPDDLISTVLQKVARKYFRQSF
jgi:hypothetical protein